MSSLAVTVPDPRFDKATALVSLSLLAAIVGLLGGFMASPEFDFDPRAGAAQVAFTIDPDADPRGHAKEVRDAQVDARFQQAVAMLHAKEYDYAVTALHRVIELAPKMPEAYVNMGFALIGLERHQAARDFFNAAIELRPYQSNAYWGLAVSLEHLGDLEGALGAMRTYIHLASPEQESYVRKARSALWEWENRLARGPLPKEEAEWIERRSKEWQDRNSPALDMPAKPSVVRDLF